MSFKNVVAVVAVVGAVLFTGQLAFAGSDTGTLTINANVIASCSIGDGTMTFSNYDPIGTHAAAALTSQADLSVQCTNGTPYGIGLDSGLNGAGDVAARKMTGPGADTLSYQLYSDAARTAVWDNNTATTTYTAASNAATPVTIYGAIAGGQVVQMGDYADTVTATINF